MTDPTEPSLFAAPPMAEQERMVEAVLFASAEPVTLAELIQKPVECCPIPSSSGSLLFIDALATGGLQSRHLDGGVLIIGGDSGVADLHCSNVSPIELVTQYLFATQEAQQINFHRLVAKPDVYAPSIVRWKRWYRFENAVRLNRSCVDSWSTSRWPPMRELIRRR